MKKFKYIFVVLVYKNIDVLTNFFQTLEVDDRKVVVVNSFYDTETLFECENVSRINGADFIPIENRGFGYGNNVGIKYVIENYLFDYLILSNSDIRILDFEYMKRLQNVSGIIAPMVRMPSGKRQNPNLPWKMSFIYPILEFAYQHRKMGEVFVHILTRASRECFLLLSRISKKKLYPVFSCHGSFIIITADVVLSLFPFFDERMFLYNEELYLAHRCLAKGIKIYYCPAIKIEHLEGASTATKNDFISKKAAESFQVFYDHIKRNIF